MGVLLFSGAAYGQFALKGKAKIRVSASHPSKVFMIQKKYLMLKLGIQDSKYLKGFTDKEYEQRFSKIVAELIMAGKRLENGEKNALHSMADTGKTTPALFENLYAGEYYIWVEGNDIRSLKIRTLEDDVTLDLYFDLSPKYLYVSSNPPGAKVFFNGIAQDGLTPARYKMNIKSEEVIVSVQKDGYGDYSGNVKPARSIVLKQGEEPRINFNLKKLPTGKFEVNTSPDGAMVYLGNKYKGRSPVSFEARADKGHQIRAEKKGYLTTYKYGARTPDGGTERVFLDLPMKKAGNFFYLGALSAGYNNDFFRQYYGQYGSDQFGYWGGEIGLRAGFGRKKDWALNTFFSYARAAQKPDSSGYISNGETTFWDLGFHLVYQFRLWRFQPFLGLGSKMTSVSEKADIENFEENEDSKLYLPGELVAGFSFHFTPKFGLYLQGRQEFGFSGEEAKLKGWAARIISLGTVFTF